MNTRIGALFLLIMLIATPAFAAITVTITSPATGETHNNLPSNIKSIPILFTITDTNSLAPSDFNVTLRWGSLGTILPKNGTTIIKDVNIMDYNTNESPTSTFFCDLNAEGSVAGSCTYNWTLPTNTTAPQGTYWVDVNVTRWFKGGVKSIADDNATFWFTINNRLSTGQATKDLMAIVGMVLASLVLLGGLASIVVLKSDITTTAIVTVVAAIAVAMAAMIIGTVLIPL